MYLPSRLQKYDGIGRAVSAVIGRAFSNGSSVVLTQMLRVPLNGLTKAMNLPSGEIWAPEISGSPKNDSRSMTGGNPFACACVRCAAASESARQEIARKKMKVVERIWEKLLNLIVNLSSCLMNSQESWIRMVVRPKCRTSFAEY